MTKERVFGQVTDPNGVTGPTFYYGRYTEGIEEALVSLKEYTAYQNLEHYDSLRKIEKLKTEIKDVQVDLMKGKEAKLLLNQIIRIIRK